MKRFFILLLAFILFTPIIVVKEPREVVKHSFILTLADYSQEVKAIIDAKGQCRTIIDNLETSILYRSKNWRYLLAPIWVRGSPGNTKFNQTSLVSGLDRKGKENFANCQEIGRKYFNSS